MLQWMYVAAIVGAAFTTFLKTGQPLDTLLAAIAALMVCFGIEGLIEVLRGNNHVRK